LITGWQTTEVTVTVSVAGRAPSMRAVISDVPDPTALTMPGPLNAMTSGFSAL
jgi:hypothetical protein